MKKEFLTLWEGLVAQYDAILSEALKELKKAADYDQWAESVGAEKLDSTPEFNCLFSALRSCASAANTLRWQASEEWREANDELKPREDCAL